MEIIGYGEDALTIWALKNKLPEILAELKDSTPESRCKVFYRPSFGRGGGANFGEFDFIILSKEGIYLGESKWDRSSEVDNGCLRLGTSQVVRHAILKCYIEEWLESGDLAWGEFKDKVELRLQQSAIEKRVPSEDTLLAENIRTVLETIKGHCGEARKMTNVLLYLYDGDKSEVPQMENEDFVPVAIDYSADKLNNFVRIET